MKLRFYSILMLKVENKVHVYFILSLPEEKPSGTTGVLRVNTLHRHDITEDFACVCF